MQVLAQKKNCVLLAQLLRSCISFCCMCLTCHVVTEPFPCCFLSPRLLSRPTLYRCAFDRREGVRRAFVRHPQPRTRRGSTTAGLLPVVVVRRGREGGTRIPAALAPSLPAQRPSFLIQHGTHGLSFLRRLPDAPARPQRLIRIDGVGAPRWRSRRRRRRDGDV